MSAAAQLETFVQSTSSKVEVVIVVMTAMAASILIMSGKATER
jgi:hypothetical protein